MKPLTKVECSTRHAHELEGKRILTPDGKDGDANGAVIKELIAAGALLAKGSLRHQYPHSWRSKAPVIFRATPQWFAAIDKPMADSVATRSDNVPWKSVRVTRWFPRQAENRMASMVETRPDWVLSRQRAWGVPIAIFVHKERRGDPGRSRCQHAHRRCVHRRKALMRGSIRRRNAFSAIVAIPITMSR